MKRAPVVVVTRNTHVLVRGRGRLLCGKTFANGREIGTTGTHKVTCETCRDVMRSVVASCKAIIEAGE